jgi:hypothetical protein
MGSPLAPDEQQFEKLMSASELATLAEPRELEITAGACHQEFHLPRQGVSLIVLAWDGD